MITNRMTTILKAGMIYLGVTILASCAMLQIPLFSVSVKAIDDTDAPISGAIVESSDGQRVTTGADGVAVLKFSSLGVHMISVLAQDRTPATFSVTMPLDTGKTMPARLGKKLDMNANINVNISGNMSGMYMTAIYPMIFQSMFNAYGYNMEIYPFKTGEWTEWAFHSGGEKENMSMRKAFLTKLDNKQEWWQMQINSSDKEGDIVFEVLFSAERQSIRRMRQKSGKNGEAAEVPVTEGWYSAPMHLTPESLEGAVVKKGVEVNVPAGKFKADILEFASMGSGDKIRMWRSKGVPGGVVRVELSHENKAEWVTELKGFGSGAKTVLNSF